MNIDPEQIIKSLSDRVKRPGRTEKRVDGKLYCCDCGEVLEKDKYFEVLGKSIRINTICSCLKKETEQEETDRKAAAKREKAKAVFESRSYMTNWTIQNADEGINVNQFLIAEQYIDEFQDVLSRKPPYDSQNGLLFYGKPGTGKTYIAAAIANELIEREFTVKFVNLPELVEKISNSPFSDKENLFQDIVIRPKMLIIDDIGIERASEYMAEQIYRIIDGRYSVRKPMIVTSNRTPKEMLEISTVMGQRIYSRILECCYAVRVDAENMRKEVIRGARNELSKHFARK